MNRNKVKILTIVALMLAITGMTLGFAAFSATLNISSSATVTPNKDDFKVVVSGSDTDSSVKEVYYVAENGATAELVYCDGLKCGLATAYFTEPGQKVTYKAYLHNIGKYTSYIKKIQFSYIEGTESKVVCTPVENGGASEELVAAACNGIRVYCSSPIQNFYNDFEFYEGDDNELPIGSVLPVNTIIEYQEGAARADGPFIVQFGDIELFVSSSN